MKTVFTTIILLFSICQYSMSQFTSKEKDLIYNDSIDIPFEVLKVTNFEDSLFLRQPSSDIVFSNNNKDLETLAARMIKTMEAAGGVGIAAPQIGIARNIFIFMRIDKPDHPICIAINPKLIEVPKETVCFVGDGCLSIPDTRGNSIRYPWVKVEYYDLNGNLIQEELSGFSRDTDFTGIIFQHEYDHLQGVLFVDKLYED